MVKCIYKEKGKIVAKKKQCGLTPKKDILREFARGRRRKNSIPPGAIQTTQPDPTRAVIVLPPQGEAMLTYGDERDAQERAKNRFTKPTEWDDSMDVCGPEAIALAFKQEASQ